MFNHSENKVCEATESGNISSSDWGQFRRSVLFPPLGNCNSICQDRVSAPLATTVSPQSGHSEEYIWTQKNLADLLAQEEKENSSLDNISLSEKHRLHFPVNINRQFINHSHKKLKSCAKINSPASNREQTQESKSHHHNSNNNNMKFRNLLSNITKAVGGTTSSSPPTTSTLPSQHKGKILQNPLTKCIIMTHTTIQSIALEIIYYQYSLHTRDIICYLLFPQK